MKKLTFLILLFYLSFGVFAQNCPIIERTGNTLRVAQPTGGSYQWFLNGNPVIGATGETFTPAIDGDYTVEVYGLSASYSQQPSDPNKVSIKVSGLAIDRLLQPVANATVHFNGQSVITDAKGRFSFSQTTVNKGRITLKYEKNGNFAAGQGLIARQNGEMKTVVCLTPKGTPLSFNADAGLNTTTKNTKIEIPATNGIKDASGEIYHGEVKAFITSYSPNDPMYGETMPGGDFIGQNNANQDVLLQSIGIAAVILEDPQGNPLNLAKPASLSFRPPKIYEALAASKNNIPLWHFDETKQLWKEEGFATKSGSWFKGK